MAVDKNQTKTIKKRTILDHSVVVKERRIKMVTQGDYYKLERGREKTVVKMTSYSTSEIILNYFFISKFLSRFHAFVLSLTVFARNTSR